MIRAPGLVTDTSTAKTGPLYSYAVAKAHSKVD